MQNTTLFKKKTYKSSLILINILILILAYKFTFNFRNCIRFSVSIRQELTAQGLVST